MSAYWISWFQPTKDPRPLTYPPNEQILGWWKTGIRCSDDASTLVAWVTADSEEEARKAVQKDWPEAEEWRFCDISKYIILSARFPLREWMKERIEKIQNEIGMHYLGEGKKNEA